MDSPSVLGKSNELFERYIDAVLGWPRMIMLSFFVVLGGLGYGVVYLTISNDFRIYFSEDNPQLLTFERLEEAFISQDNVYFFIKPKNIGKVKTPVFQADVLSLIKELTDEGWKLPYSGRVSSLANYQHTLATKDELFTNYLIPDELKLTARNIKQIKNIALNDPQILNTLVSKSGEVTGINVQLTLPENNARAAHEAVLAARILADRLREKYPVTILIAGSAATNVTLSEAVRSDLFTLVWVSYFLIFGGLALLLRSLSGTLVILIIVSLSVLGTVGTFGYMQYQLTPVAGFVPSVLMTMAVADSVHVLVSYYYLQRNGLDKNAAIREAMRINVAPVFITSITTTIGVLCLNFSDSPPYRDLGNMIGFGVMLAYFLTMGFLPAFLSLVPGQPYSVYRYRLHPMTKFSNVIIKQRKILALIVGLFVLVLLSFTSRNTLTERWHEYFDDSFEVRRAVDEVNRHFGGLHSIYYNLDTGIENGIHNPDYLKELSQFAEWYRQQPEVSHVDTFSDTIKRLNKNMHSDDDAWYRIPDDSKLAAQYLLLYELSLPLGLGLDNTINHKKSATLLRAVVSKTDSEDLLAIDRRARQWLQDNAAHILETQGSGLDIVFAHINHRNIRSMLVGTVLALVLISMVLMLALKSVRLGLISLLPNLAPAGMAYGIWGLLFGHVNLALSIVICMSLGIVVDDTVHFLSKYLRARREKNLSSEEGIRYAFVTVGVALTITTLVLVTGFSVMTLSSFTPTRETGILMAFTLSFALLVDFLLLPPLLLFLDKALPDRLFRYS